MVFPGGMPAIGAALSEDDLAALLSYIRQAWGNKASPITPQQIRAVKAEVGNRAEAFTEEGLGRVPEK
jgi:mono/diheme cytochrome c family protein